LPHIKRKARARYTTIYKQAKDPKNKRFQNEILSMTDYNTK
jgi:hypothetical protein